MALRLTTYCFHVMGLPRLVIKAVSVWCSKDRAQALTKAKNGEELPAENCDNPVAAHFEIGQKVGVTGTPAILTADGELMPGYLPAKQLAQRLDDMAKK